MPRWRVSCWIGKCGGQSPSMRSGAYPASCTGTLLNDADSETSIPYFLTRQPLCVYGQGGANRADHLVLPARQLRCRDAGRTHHHRLPAGAELLATSVPQDSTLLRIRQRLPANVYFAGWDATPAQSDELVVGIHHPKGEVKKYAAGVVTRYGGFPRRRWRDQDDLGRRRDGRRQQRLCALPRRPCDWRLEPRK